MVLPTNQMNEKNQTNQMNEDLLNILACPVCKGTVELRKNKIVCLSCGRKYPIREGIPIMLEEEAEIDKGGYK